MTDALKQRLRPFIPSAVLAMKKRFYYWLIDEQRTVGLDLFKMVPNRVMPRHERADYVRRMREIQATIQCAHTHDEMLEIVRAILASDAPPNACVVEAGCFKGGSTAKL